MVKDRITFDPEHSVQDKIDIVAAYFKEHSPDTRDGLKVDFPDSWVQLRRSNTEPIVRIYAEARTVEAARKLVEEVKALL